MGTPEGSLPENLARGPGAKVSRDPRRVRKQHLSSLRPLGRGSAHSLSSPETQLLEDAALTHPPSPQPAWPHSRPWRDPRPGLEEAPPAGLAGLCSSEQGRSQHSWLGWLGIGGRLPPKGFLSGITGIGRDLFL